MTLKSLLQHHSSKVAILQCSAFFIVQLSYPYMTTGKTIALTRQTFFDKVMSLLFNMLSRLVITFLPRNKHLLISWLQSPSAVILEPRKIMPFPSPGIKPRSPALQADSLSAEPPGKPNHHLGGADPAITLLLAFQLPELRGSKHLLSKPSGLWRSVRAAPANECCCCCCSLVTPSRPTLCDPLDCHPPGSSVCGFPRQEYWSGVPFPLPGDLPKPGTEPATSAWQTDSLPLSHLGSPC